MEDIVKIINKKGNSYEVTRSFAEKMVKNGDITHNDIYEISAESDSETVDSDIFTEYETKFGKKVPSNKKNDIEWIKLQLTK